MKIWDGWLFWALGASLVWGVGQVVIKKSLATFSPLAYNALSTLVGLLIFLPYALFLGVRLQKLDLPDVLLVVLITASYLAYYYLIALEAVSLVGTVIATYPLFTILFSVPFLGERMTPEQVLSVLLIVTGVVLIGLPQNKLSDLTNKDPESKNKKWFWLAILFAALTGFTDFLAKIAVTRLGVANYFFLFQFAALPGLWLIYLLDPRGRRLPKITKNVWLLGIAGVVLIELGNIFFFNAFARGPASLVSPIAGSYQALTLILALILLKEKLNRFQALGVGLTLLGVVLVGQ